MVNPSELLSEKIKNKTTRSLGRIFSVNVEVVNFLKNATSYMLVDTPMMQRLYHWHHNIKEVSNCSICGKQKKFKTFDIGYQCTSKCVYKERVLSMLLNSHEPPVLNRDVLLIKINSLDVSSSHLPKVLVNSKYELGLDLIRYTNWLPNDASMFERIYILSNNLKSRPKCPICKIVTLKYKVNNRRYSKYCSASCSAKSDETIRKRKTTSDERYGKGNYCNRDKANETLKSLSDNDKVKIREKIKQTNLKKYGDENFNNRDKAIITCQEKYGVEYVTQSNEMKLKSKATKLERYGDESFVNPNKTKVTKLERYGDEHYNNHDKTKVTKLERYGDEHYNNAQQISKTHLSHNELQKCEINKQRQETNVKRYGVEFPLQNEQIKSSIIDTCQTKYGVDSVLQLPYVRNHSKHTLYDQTYKGLFRFSKFVLPLFSREEYNGNTNQKIYKWQCQLCDHKFNDKYENGVMPRCLKCFPFVKSQIENDIASFIENELNILVKRNDRTIIKPLELDICTDKIAIEVNGLYYHSELNGKDKMYHINKTEKCLEQQKQLIHIFEDEWYNKEQIVCSRLRQIFGLTTKRIFARKCKVINLSAQKTREFLEENHIQGSDNSPIRYGLIYQDELVSVMTFAKPRFSKDYEYELVRFANKLNTSVVGAASKLLKAFCKEYNPKNIISYADRRWSTGNLYEKIGFNLSHVSSPNYWYVINGKRESRIKFQKHKLKEKIEFFDETKTEYENMLANGIDRIWDCGNLVYIMNC